MQNSIFNIDLHVHTARYSDCAETLDPEKIEAWVKQSSLGGVVLTEHDTMWHLKSFFDLQHSCPEIVFYNGMEVTAGNGHHFVVIGLETAEPVYKLMPASDLIALAHENEGVVILAHPFRNGLPDLKIVRQVDAIEIGSTSLGRLESKLAEILARELGIPAVACSDAHSLEKIGWAYTAFPQVPGNVGHLCEMIREGRGVPVLNNGYR